MDNLGLFIYLIGIVDSVKDIFKIGIIICFIACLVLFFRYLFEIDDNGDSSVLSRTFKRYIIICVIVCFLLGLAQGLTPSSKTIAAMYVLPAIAKNEDIKHIANDNLKSLRLLSEKWLMELMKEDKEK